MGAAVGDDGLRARIAELEAELAKAREDNRMLRQTLLHAPDFVGHVTLDGRFLYLNRPAAGRTPEEIDQMSIWGITEPEYHDTLRATIARVVETRQPQSYEAVRDGRPYFTRIAPMVDEEGAVKSVVLIATEVTQLKQAEAALAESQAMLEQVIAASQMGMWWWDLDAELGGRDERASQILGMVSTEVERTTSEAAVAFQHPEDRPRIQAAMEEALRTGAYGPIEHRVIRPDGEVRWIIASGRIVETPTGRKLVGGVIDLTDRKRLEEGLAQAQKLESIGRLAGGIAHDFNNMLTAILSYTDFALAAVPPESGIAKDLAQAREATNRSIALTSQLLAFARRQFIEPTLADLDAIVLRVDKLLRRVLGADIEVVTLLAARAPVKIDVTQFEQVLLNLATNARDAMPQGGRLTIETRQVTLAEALRSVPPGDYVLLTVTDTGVGIPESLLSRVFEPFFTTKSATKGTGLGLATCYGVVAQNRGHILVESTVGKGTRFAIYLPRAEGELPQPETVTTSAQRTGSETVLVVEDEPSVRAVTVKALVQAGYRVLAASNGSEAITLARDHAGPIELLVTDVVMPHVGGLQLAQILTAVRPDLAVLYTSGYTDSEGIHQGVREGGVDLLQKPFSPTVLAERVRQAIDRRRR